MNAQRSPLPTRSLLILAACALLVLAFAPAQYFGRQEDDVLYLIAARALTSGKYCLLTSPGCPPLLMTNPGWPALLAPLALATDRIGPFQAFSALVSAAMPLALWAWVRRRTDEATALIAAALAAACPLALAQSGVVMAEPAFTLCLIGLIAAAESGRAGIAGAAGAALLLLRTAGVAAMPALAAPFLRGRRALAAAMLPPAAAAAGWTAWSFSVGGTVGKFNLLSSTYGGGFWLKLPAVAAANARYYAGELGGCFLPPRLASETPAVVLGAALALIAGRGLLVALRRRADDPAAWTLIGFAGLLSAWGWQYERYLIPLIPLGLWALALGFGRAAKPALALLLALELGAQTLPRLARPSPWAEPELARTYAWLAARPRPALLSSAQPVRDGWLSGLPNAPLPDVERDEDFAAALKSRRVSEILRVDGQDFGLEADPNAALRRHLLRTFSHLDNARLFRLVHEEPAERARVYEPL